MHGLQEQEKQRAGRGDFARRPDQLTLRENGVPEHVELAEHQDQVALHDDEVPEGAELVLQKGRETLHENKVPRQVEQALLQDQKRHHEDVVPQHAGLAQHDAGGEQENLGGAACGRGIPKGACCGQLQTGTMTRSVDSSGAAA